MDGWRDIVLSIHYLLFRIAPYWVEWGVMLLPLTIYLLFLAYGVTNKNHPVLLSRVKDRSWLAFGLSGFILLGPLSWILHPILPRGPLLYWGFYALFLIALLLIVVSRIGRKAGCVVYNLPEPALLTILETIKSKYTGEWQTVPGRISLDQGNAIINYEVTRLWQNVDFEYLGEKSLYSNFDRLLQEQLSTVETKKNPAASALSIWGAVCLLISTMSFVLYFWYKSEL